MTRHGIPRVVDNHLLLLDHASQGRPILQVGSETWYAWLNEPTTRSFSFHGPEGILTMRREQRHGARYWYAYRSQNGQLRKTYLGKSEELTAERLQTAASKLSVKSAPPTRPPSPSQVPPLHLLTTKISIPAASAKIVTRPRLTQHLQAAIQRSLTLLIAPAGWGKTTLLSAWHTSPHRASWPLAWVSLDAGDSDPLRFWTYLLTALGALHSGVSEASLALLYASSSPPIETVLTALLNALNQVSTETVLVLDDYHFIEARPIHEALSYLVEHLPVTVHLALASRADPPLLLARLRAQGALSELRAANLRFTVEESTTFLTELMGLPLSARQVAALQDRTEGWIAGLHLAALSLQGREDVAGFISTFAGSHHYIVDYLVEEVLSRQPANIQDFLVQTCILERLCSSLCDAVRGQNESQALLSSVERSNLFLVALDEERQWYRYHHLFAEALRSRLQRHQPALVPNLHRRASRWYEQHELVEEAVAHALAVPEVDRAAALIEQYNLFTNFPSQFQVLQRWLNRLPEPFVRSQPLLCLLHGITLLLTHQLERATTRIQDAERCLAEEMPAEQRRTILGIIAASRSLLARLLGDYEQAIPLAQRALDLLPEKQETLLLRMVSRITFLTAASAYLLDGDLTPVAERQVESTVVSMRAGGTLPTIMRSLANLARLHLLQGRLRWAASTIEQVAHLASGQEGIQAQLNVADYYFLLGELLREQNHLDLAEQHLQQGMDLDRGTSLVTIQKGYAVARSRPDLLHDWHDEG